MAHLNGYSRSPQPPLNLAVPQPNHHGIPSPAMSNSHTPIQGLSHSHTPIPGLSNSHTPEPQANGGVKVQPLLCSGHTRPVVHLQFSNM